MYSNSLFRHVNFINNECFYALQNSLNVLMNSVSLSIKHCSFTLIILFKCHWPRIPKKDPHGGHSTCRPRSHMQTIGLSLKTTTIRITILIWLEIFINQDKKKYRRFVSKRFWLKFHVHLFYLL